jgi:two-component system sensor histidine kinase UhpB
MGMMLGNSLLSTSVIRGLNNSSDKIIDIGVPRLLDGAAGRAKRYSRSKAEAKVDEEQSEGGARMSRLDDAGGFRILVVNNEQQERLAIRTALSRHLNVAIEYIEAWSGEIALQIAAREAVDMIIFGDDISDMDGLLFLDRLNRKSGKQKVPVIEILNSGAARTGIQAMKMGAHDYLLKDFNGHHFELLPILVSRIYAEQQALKTLRHSAGVHQTITDSIPSVIYQLSLQGGRHEVNISRQIAELGFSADQWGNDAELHHQMCHEDDREAVKQALEYSYKTGTAFQCEYRINTAGNKLRWFRDKANVVMDKYGRPLFLQGVMTDITGLKSLETELKHYRHMMDKLVRQRTERLERRVAILESCNSSLSDNYGRMRELYLELLIRLQAGEGELGAGGTT